MANNRKIQGEIDKLMKKVTEGMDIYEETFEKVNEASNQIQKEKFEAELKKEIKKLQRLREQVKILIANPEVKDKSKLEVTRRNIEIKMEGFKICERETKTKAFSKEGLASAARSDPADKARAATEGWINQSIDTLQQTQEQVEFDLENEAPGKKGKKSSKSEDLEQRIGRIKYHKVKLEQLLRMVVNEELSPEEVDDIQMEVEEYVEGISENPHNYEEPDQDPYDMFDLPDVVVADTESEDDEPTPSPVSPKKEEKKKETPPAPKAAPPKAAAKKAPEPVAVKKAQPAQQKTPAAAVATPKQPLPAPGSNKVQPASPLTGRTAAEVVAGTKSTPAATQPAAAPSASKPELTIAAGPKGPINPPTPTVAEKTVSSPLIGNGALPKPGSAMLQQPPSSMLGGTDELLEDDDDMNDDTFGDDAMDAAGKAGAPTGSLADLSAMTKDKASWGEEGRGPSDAAAFGMPPPTAQRSAWANPEKTSAVIGRASSTPSTPAVPSPLSQAPALASPLQAQPQPTAASQANTSPQPQPTPTQPTTTTVTQPSLDKAGILKMLEVSYKNLPDSQDVERLKPYTPPNPYQTPSFYPQTVHPAFSQPETFSRFDADILFFIFYYQQTTYQQYLAAKELKRQSWRFHKKFQTWFQRHDRPRQASDDQEQGTYIYFDYESGWCQRIKSDFTFRYSYLEDELV